MIVQFDATIDDLVDVSIRSSADSKTMRFWRWQGAAVTALLAGFPVYLFVSGTTLERSSVACVSGLIAGAVTLWTDKGAYRKRLHKLCIYEWSRIERVEESEDALYFFYRDHACSAVRKRGFESVAIKDEFLKRAETYIQQSRGPHCSKS